MAADYTQDTSRLIIETESIRILILNVMYVMFRTQSQCLVLKNILLNTEIGHVFEVEKADFSHVFHAGLERWQNRQISCFCANFTIYNVHAWG